MVQPVDCRQSELHLLPFRDLEALEDSKVAVKVGGSVDVRTYQRSLRTLRRQSEAVRIKVGAGSMLTWIARNQRHDLRVAAAVLVCSEPCRRVDVARLQPIRQGEGVIGQARSTLRRVGESTNRQVQVATTIRLDRRSR